MHGLFPKGHLYRLLLERPNLIHDILNGLSDDHIILALVSDSDGEGHGHLFLGEFRLEQVLVVAAHLRHECGLDSDLPEGGVEGDEGVERCRGVFLHQ